MALQATQMRPGMIIMHEKELFSVFSITHRTPGNLRAFVQAKLRNLRTGATIEYRFRAGDSIDRQYLDETEMEYLYNDNADFHFMNTESYDQVHLSRATLGDAVDYLIPNLRIKIAFFEGKPVSVDLPQTVDLEVKDTEPGLKGSTVSNVTKPATMETGLIVQVPAFINPGEKIRVDTAEGTYLERVT